MKLIGILLILWELLADWLEPLIKSRFGKWGLSIYGAVLLYSRIRDGAQRRVLEREVKSIKKQVRTLSERLGEAWDVDENDWCQSTAKRPLRLSQTVISLVRTIVLFIRRKVTGKSTLRRRNKMSVNKTWIVGLLGYIAFFVKQAFPELNIPDELLDKVADLVLLIIGIVAMVANMKKPKPPQHPFEGVQPSGTNQSTIGDHGPMV